MIRNVFLLGLSREHDFRPGYKKLGTLSSVCLSAKMVTGEYQKVMGYMKNPSLVIANPDRANIFLSIHTKTLICNVDEFEELLSPIAEELIVHMSVTNMNIIYS